MEFLDFIIDLLYHLSFLFDDTSSTHQKNRNKKLEATFEQETYVIGILATAITIFYEDDERLDKTERKIIMKLLKRIPYKLSRESKKFINTLLKNKINLYELKLLYIRRDINHKMILTILGELESILAKSNKNMNKNLNIIHQLKSEYLESKCGLLY